MNILQKVSDTASELVKFGPKFNTTNEKNKFYFNIYKDFALTLLH